MCKHFSIIYFYTSLLSNIKITYIFQFFLSIELLSSHSLLLFKFHEKMFPNGRLYKSLRTLSFHMEQGKILKFDQYIQKILLTDNKVLFIEVDLWNLKILFLLNLYNFLECVPYFKAWVLMEIKVLIDLINYVLGTDLVP